MWGLIVVLGLVAVVILVGVLVALGMKASRSGDDDDWMSDDEQPRGRRAGRSRGRRARGDDPDDEPYGGDMRVAGGAMAGQAPHHQLPAAPMGAPGPAPLPAGSAPVPERPSDEMDDDEYWSTITFDKPKFPWRQDKDQPAGPRGQDPLGPGEPMEPVAPTRIQDAVPPVPAPAPQNGHGVPHGSPLDSPAPPTAPQPAVTAGPLDGPSPSAGPLSPAALPSTLDVPVGHAGEAEPTSTTPAYGAADQNGGFSYGGDTASPYGDDPLGTGERSSYGSLPPVPPSTPAPSAGSPAAGPAADDPLKLPSVDELLAKIQSDRQRSSGSDSSSSGFDPLSDPLDTGERPSYGSSSSGSNPLGGWSSDSSPSYGSSSGYGTPSAPDSSSSYGSSADSPYGADPLSGGYSSTSGYGSSSYDSGAYSGSGYSSSGGSYGSGSPAKDDPLGGGYPSSSSDYGSYGTNGDASSSGGYSASGYSTPGSSYGSGYYGSSSSSTGNGYGGASGGPGADEADKTQAYPSSPYGSSYAGKKTDDQRSDDWGSYGDYRS